MNSSLRLFIRTGPIIAKRAYLSSDTQSRINSIKNWQFTLGKTDDDSGYTIKLNNINLKTPMNNLLKINDETLALAVLNEWRGQANKKQKDLKIMNLTTLAYDAIDNPFKESLESVVDSIVEYLKFDTVRFRDVDQEELLKLQTRHWDPIVGWFEHQFDCHVPIEYGDLTSTTQVPDKSIEIITRHLRSHTRWPLVGIRSMTKNLKSFIVTAGLTQRFLTVEQAVDLARLETKFQTEKWSKVESEHDIDEHCTTARVAAGTLFYHLTV